jgi:hypothetical protein
MMTISHRSTEIQAPQSSSYHSRHIRPRHSSSDNNDDGCCLLKSFISNMLAFATRSSRHRKPDAKEIRNPPGASLKKSGASLSQVKKKAPSSELCVADSFDDQMLDRLTAIPYGMERNEWLATNTLALFEHVNALCGTITELCTAETCPVMSYPGTS